MFEAIVRRKLLRKINPGEARIGQLGRRPSGLWPNGSPKISPGNSTYIVHHKRYLHRYIESEGAHKSDLNSPRYLESCFRLPLQHQLERLARPPYISTGNSQCPDNLHKIQACLMLDSSLIILRLQATPKKVISLALSYELNKEVLARPWVC